MAGLSRVRTLSHGVDGISVLKLCVPSDANTSDIRALALDHRQIIPFDIEFREIMKKYQTDTAPKKSVKQSVDFVGKDVLEIGCSSGKFTLDYLLQAKSILGIDPDPEGIETLIKSWPQNSQPSVDFRVADILELSLPPDAFDVVVFSRSL